MRGGQLRHRISIQYQEPTEDEVGGETLVWTELFKARAAIWPVSSKEVLDAKKLESVITNKIRIRYRAGITSKNRIVFIQTGEIYNIVGKPINPDRRNIMLDILCTEDE